MRPAPRAGYGWPPTSTGRGVHRLAHRRARGPRRGPDPPGDVQRDHQARDRGGVRQPRDLNLALVDAQQARRIIDRLVGYKLSPLVASKIRRGLTAGRVQSVAVRLVVDREREIQAFTPVEYWTIGRTSGAASRASSSVSA